MVFCQHVQFTLAEKNVRGYFEQNSQVWAIAADLLTVDLLPSHVSTMQYQSVVRGAQADNFTTYNDAIVFSWRAFIFWACKVSSLYKSNIFYQHICVKSAEGEISIDVLTIILGN